MKNCAVPVFSMTNACPGPKKRTPVGWSMPVISGVAGFLREAINAICKSSLQSARSVIQRPCAAEEEFHDFYHFAGYLSSERSEIRGISVEGHLDENYFIVVFCGQIFEFRFSVTLDKNGAAKGVVSCYTLDSVNPSQRTTVTTFTYSGTGTTDVQKPEDIEDVIALDSEVGAVFLVCYCLHNALTR